MSASRISIIAAIGGNNRVLGKYSVTRQKEYDAPGATVCNSLHDAIVKASAAEESNAGATPSKNPPSDASEIFIIGGGELYREALPFAHKLYLTLVEDDAEGDVFFPEYEHQFTKKVFEEKHESKGIAFTWVDLERA